MASKRRQRGGISGGAVSGPAARSRARPYGDGSLPGRNKNDSYTREKRDARQPFDEKNRGSQPRRRGKQTTRRKPKGKLLPGILLGIAGALLLGYLAIQLFETKEITVTGSRYCSEQEIRDWLFADNESGNSLYLLWKYNQNDVKQLPAVEETRVTLKGPGQIQVQVKEKDFSGRIDYNGVFLYFDQEGIASLITETVIEGVPYIEGIEIKPEEVFLGSVLPVTDGQIFDELKELMPLLEKQGLSPDKISCAGTDLTLHFGNVRVQIGNSQFADRLAQVPPILEKLTELYADQTGVLHLENYDISGSSIRFVPDTAAGLQPDSQ